MRRVTNAEKKVENLEWENELMTNANEVKNEDQALTNPALESILHRGSLRRGSINGIRSGSMFMSRPLTNKLSSNS